MAGKNNITGDNLISKVNTKSYDDGWERIFGKKKKEKVECDLSYIDGWPNDKQWSSEDKSCKKCGFIQQKPNIVLCEACGSLV
jgi:hypothetical protein